MQYCLDGQLPPSKTEVLFKVKVAGLGTVMGLDGFSKWDHAMNWMFVFPSPKS